MVELTGRQREFLERFVDLHLEAKRPLHYGAVSERLGVSRITAYEMLRVLEKKGLVKSTYAVPAGRSAGRSTIVFRPTAKGRQLVARLADEDWEQAGWPEVKERTLAALRAGGEGDREELFEEMLLRLEDQKTPLLAATGVITAAILSLNRLEREAEVTGLGEQLRSLGAPGELGLSALACLTVGLALVGQANPRLASQITAQISQFQEQLAQLTAESKQRLSEYALAAWEIVEA